MIGKVLAEPRGNWVQVEVQDSGKIRGQRFARLPAGRAILLGDSDSPTYVQLVNPLVGEAAMLFVGVMMVVGGLMEAGHAFWRRRWSGFFVDLLGGLLYVLVGVLILDRPLIARMRNDAPEQPQRP